jgi:aminoglycoside 2'-N-acetyltransferase I
VTRRSDIESDRLRLRRILTADLTPPEVTVIRDMLLTAFGEDDEERFGDDDWDHALGGVHFVLDLDSEIVAHAAVVERELHVDGRPLRTAYVEAVATAANRQRAGFGTLVMTDVTAYIGERFELGALGTGLHGFYERLGWRTWAGPTSVRTSEGTRRTPGEDGYLLVLSTPLSPRLDVTAPISCDWRAGDVW